MTATCQLQEIVGRNVLIVERFDRVGEQRIGFASAMTLLELSDMEPGSYLDLAAALEATGAHPDADLRQTWRRMIFSQLVSDVDNHLRNHGLLWAGNGWTLSPTYDVNPEPDQRRSRATPVATRSPDDIATSLQVAEYFRLTQLEAKEILNEVMHGIHDWRTLAGQIGISRAEIAKLRSAFETKNYEYATAVLGAPT